MQQVLIKDEKYTGKYVAITEIAKPVILSSGDDPQKVYAEALQKGYVDPILLFVPERDLIQIY